MLGGVNNGLFFQGFGGFFAILILIPILIWMSASATKRKARRERKALKKSLRAVKRK
jgi:hypothetical protein